MRKGELIINYALILIPLFVGISVLLSISIFIAMPSLATSLMVALFLVGFISFATAKYSVISQNLFYTFGSSNMNKTNRMAYYFGYGAMAVGLILLLGFAIYTNH